MIQKNITLGEFDIYTIHKYFSFTSLKIDSCCDTLKYKNLKDMRKWFQQIQQLYSQSWSAGKKLRFFIPGDMYYKWTILWDSRGSLRKVAAAQPSFPGLHVSTLSSQSPPALFGIQRWQSRASPENKNSTGIFHIYDFAAYLITRGWYLCGFS